MSFELQEPREEDLLDVNVIRKLCGDDAQTMLVPFEMTEPREEDLLDVNVIRKLCGGDAVTITMFNSEGQKVSWKDIIEKKINRDELTTVMTYQDGKVEVM